MHLGEVIKKYRHDHGRMSMQAFADKCGLSKGYIAMLERNKNSKTGDPVVPSVETFIKVAKAMNMTLSELADIVDENQPVALTDNTLTKDSMFYHIASENGLDKITEMIWGVDDNKKSPTGVSIPIVSTIVAGMPADAYEDPLGYEEISFELAKTGDFVCLKVKGDSMSPIIQEGDLVVVRQQNDVESGDIAVVRVNGDEATLKKVQKSPEGITLIAYNPAVYPPHFYSNKEIEELPVEVDGKVVEMKRMF